MAEVAVKNVEVQKITEIAITIDTIMTKAIKRVIKKTKTVRRIAKKIVLKTVTVAKNVKMDIIIVAVVVKVTNIVETVVTIKVARQHLQVPKTRNTRRRKKSRNLKTWKPK